MSCRVSLKQSDLGRGYAVFLLLILDIEPGQGQEPYFVAVTRDGRIRQAHGPLPWASAFEIYEMYAIAETPWSWRNVLARLMGKPAEQPGVWENSIGEYAARRFKLGSWNWVRTLMAHRKNTEARALGAQQ